METASSWLEYFADARNADFFAPIIEKPTQLLVPAVSIYEVFKRNLQQRDENEDLKTIAVMAQGRVVDLDDSLALEAAKLSVDYKLPITDSMILATAWAYKVTLWTQGEDFKGLHLVKYIPKKSTAIE